MRHIYVCFPSAASDYSTVSQELVFPAGTSQRMIALPIIEDSVLEGIESFSVNLSVPASHAGVVLLGTDTATISIIDDDSKWVHKNAECQYWYYIVELVCDWWFLSSCENWILIKCV